MTLAIKINGQPYENFTSASVTASITALTRGFSFVSTADKNASFAIKIGDGVTITADDIDLLEGYIERLESSYDTMGHEIRVSGRSALMDLADSTIPPTVEIKGTSLTSICRSVFSLMGIDAEVSNEAGTIRNFSGEISSGEIGQNAFEFLEKYSRKRQVLLTSDGANTLVLARAGTNRAPTNLKNVRYADDNNILQATLSIDDSKRYNFYVAKSQLNTTIPSFDKDPEDIVNQQGSIRDTEIREGRSLHFNAEESSDSFTAKDRATWEKNIRINQAWNYNAKVAGNTANGQLWLPNTIVKVVDNYCNIDAELLIRDVTHNYDNIGGSTTALTMVLKRAFTLELEQSQRKANQAKTGDPFFA